jgi:hypothetical protein
MASDPIEPWRTAVARGSEAGALAIVSRCATARTADGGSARSRKAASSWTSSHSGSSRVSGCASLRTLARNGPCERRDLPRGRGRGPDLSDRLTAEVRVGGERLGGPDDLRERSPRGQDRSGPSAPRALGARHRGTRCGHQHERTPSSTSADDPTKRVIRDENQPRWYSPVWSPTGLPRTTRRRVMACRQKANP